ncbi:MAG: hypothetical protein QOD84_2742 [Acidobacteriaceae bacterium]|jgi:hypothetical protein
MLGYTVLLSIVSARLGRLKVLANEQEPGPFIER